jgi:hypothetical protein
MSAKSKKRPLLITILSAFMIVLGIGIIAYRSYFLRLNLLPMEVLDSGEALINLKLVSGISLVGIGVIPLTLGIGLWRLSPWARAISICLSCSFLFPCLAAAIGLIEDPLLARERNLALAGASAIALWILLSPAIAKVFAGNELAVQEADRTAS